MADKPKRAYGRLIAAVALAAAAGFGCESQNSFVLGTAPASVSGLSNRRTDIVDKDQAVITIFFNKCITEVNEGGGRPLADGDFVIERAMVSNFAGCIPASGGLFNFDDCFSDYESLDAAAVINDLTWVTTDGAPGSCALGGHDKLLIQLNTGAGLLWPAGTSSASAAAVKLSWSPELVLKSNAGELSYGAFEMYFIIRDRTAGGDSAGPHLTASYPANRTGIADELPTPFPPHYPINLVFNEPLLNMEIITADLTWSDTTQHSPFERAAFPEVSYQITGQRDFRLSFRQGLPPGIDMNILLLTTPADYDDLAYESGSGRPALENILQAPNIDLFGNDILFPVSAATAESPPGSDIFSGEYGGFVPNESFAHELRVGPILITSPEAGEAMEAKYHERGVAARALPGVTGMKMEVDHWRSLGLSQPYLILNTAPGGGIAPLSKLSLADVPGPALAPAISRDGKYLAYWARDKYDLLQVFRRDLADPGRHPEQVSGFIGGDSVETEADLAGHPISISDDGRVIVFRSGRDREHSPDGESGEIYYWRKSEPSALAVWLQLSAKNQLGAAANYDPIVSGDGAYVFFWSENDPAGGAAAAPQILRCILIADSAPPDPRFACVALVQNDTAGPAADPRISATSDGQVLAFVSAGDLDLAAGNADHNPEIFLWDGEVHQLTDSGVNGGATVVNSSPALLVGRDLEVYFTSNGDYHGGPEVSNTDASTELFVYGRLSDPGRQSAYYPIEQITATPAGRQTIHPAVAANGEKVAVFSNYDFSNSELAGWHAFILEPEREYNLIEGTTTPQISYDVWALPMAAAECPGTGEPVPWPSLDDSGTEAVFSTFAQLLAGDTNPHSNAYAFHFDGLYVGFELTWNQIRARLNLANATSLTTGQFLPPGQDLTLKVGSTAAEALGFDELGFSFPPSPDTDTDGMPDWWEQGYLCVKMDQDDSLQDADQDDLTNLEEFEQGTDPCRADTDGDLLPDRWEVLNNTDPLVKDGLAISGGVTTDPDDDGLENFYEYQFGTDPQESDSDHDGLNDLQERDLGSNPNDSDSDDDTISDGQENNSGANPINDDSDLDGIGDSLDTNPVNADSDGDGLRDGEELQPGINTDPADPDSDDDGLWDGWEVTWQFNPLVADSSTLDTDGDGLTNLEEFLQYHDHTLQLNPRVPDTDQDGLSDAIEIAVATSPVRPDTDRDGLSDFIEVKRDGNPNTLIIGPGLDTNPNSPDTDGDRIPDATEDADRDGILDNDPDHPETDPTRADSDGDEINDYDEILLHTNPRSWDSDGDGFSDGEELDFLSDPNDGNSHPFRGPDGEVLPAFYIFPDQDGDGLGNDEDTDGDGWVDFDETNPWDMDSDGDGLPDGWEVGVGFDPLAPASCLDNADGDGLTDRAEFLAGTDPVVDDFAADSDGDGMPDYWEFYYDLDPYNRDDAGEDPDDDGLSNLDEFVSGADPWLPDTDGDGVDDGDEVSGGSNPHDDYVTPSSDPMVIGDEIRITYDVNSSMDPSLVWTGSNYALAWTDTRTGNYDIFFSRLGADGSTSDDYQITSSDLSDSQPYMTWAGSEFGLAWVKVYSRFSFEFDEITFRRLKNNDTPLQDAGNEVRLTFSRSFGDENNSPSLTWSGTEFGIIWRTYSLSSDTGILFRRVDSAGALIGSNILVREGAEYADIVWDDTANYGIAMEDSMESYFAVFDDTGTRVTNDVHLTGAIPEVRGLDLAWSGSEYGISWAVYEVSNNSYKVFFARLSNSGVLQSSNEIASKIPAQANYNDISLVWADSEYGVCWANSRSGYEQLYFHKISTTGVAVGNTLSLAVGSLAVDEGIVEGVSIAWTGSEYGISWPDLRDGNAEIYFARIQPTSDRDGDGLKEAEEINLGTDLADWDSDDDGLPDGWENQYSSCGLNPLEPDASSDFDDDGLRNATEYLYKTNPCQADPFGDGYHSAGAPSGAQAAAPLSAAGRQSYPVGATESPEGPDSDQDGLPDSVEDANGNGTVDSGETDPLDPDTDGDGLADGWEHDRGLDPCDPDDTALDQDGDGLSNFNECDPVPDPPFVCMLDYLPLVPDSDYDGYPDGWEVTYGPAIGFTLHGPQCAADLEDPDGDYLINLMEGKAGTNPSEEDTDFDGMDDLWEYIAAMNPFDSEYPCDAGVNPLAADDAADPDCDGRSNLVEYANEGWMYTNPHNPDTDGDGLCDGVAVVGSCAGVEAEGVSDPLARARFRLNPHRPAGAVTAVTGGATGGGDAELGDGSALVITGGFDAGSYLARLDDGRGHSYWLTVTTDQNGLIEADPSSFRDFHGNLIPAGQYTLTLFSAGPGALELLGSNSMAVTLRRFLFIHSGIHGPTLATDPSGGVIWRRAYEPFGAPFLEKDSITTGSTLFNPPPANPE